MRNIYANEVDQVVGGVKAAGALIWGAELGEWVAEHPQEAWDDAESFVAGWWNTLG